jgi:pimeloyl-ACP methyl ester carboxylesterase
MIEVLNIQPAVQTHAPADTVRVDYRSDRDDWAMVLPAPSELYAVVLHGHGSHGDQLLTRPDIRQMWLPALQRHRMGIVCPNLRDNAWMNLPAVRDLHDLLVFVRSEYGAKRFIFFSGSMGGTGNLIYAALHPQDVAACVALGAATELLSYVAWCRSQTLPIVHEIADAIDAAYPDDPAIFRRHSSLYHAEHLTMPVYLCHGGADEIIPVEQSRRLAGRMADQPHFTYREIADGGHDAPLADGDALDWVLSRIS